MKIQIKTINNIMEEIYFGYQNVTDINNIELKTPILENINFNNDVVYTPINEELDVDNIIKSFKSGMNDEKYLQDIEQSWAKIAEMNIKLRLKTEKITANMELLKKLNDVVNNLVQYNTVMPEKKT